MSDEFDYTSPKEILAWRGEIMPEGTTAELTALRARLAQAEAENAVMVSALKGLVDAVANMRVPQNVVDAGLQINVTLGPAYEAAVAALSRHGNPAPQTERSE